MTKEKFGENLEQWMLFTDQLDMASIRNSEEENISQVEDCYNYMLTHLNIKENEMIAKKDLPMKFHNNCFTICWEKVYGKVLKAGLAHNEINCTFFRCIFVMTNLN